MTGTHTVYDCDCMFIAPHRVTVAVPYINLCVETIRLISLLVMLAVKLKIIW